MSLKDPCKTLKADFHYRDHKHSRVNLQTLAEHLRKRSFSAAKKKHGGASKLRTPSKTERVRETEKKQIENEDERKKDPPNRTFTQRSRAHTTPVGG